MRNKKKIKNPPSYYAKILIVVALTLLIYGGILDIDNSTRLYDPIKDVTKEQSPIINITTVDETEVGSENSAVNPTPSEQTITPASPENTKAPAQQPINNSNNNQQPQQTQNNNNTPHSPTIEEQNNQLRKDIENTYDIKVYYGNETSGYTVGGLSTSVITSNEVISNNLYKLRGVLALYPNGFFKEIKKGGIPLKVYLIQSYSQKGVTGVTNSDYYHADISISADYPFEESFYHESYHYIERYMFKKGATFTTWDSLNPSGITYGNINTNNSYATTFLQDAPFVNNYAQTSPEEDRASTFEYMMASSKASCLNRGTIVWNKANTMKNTIEVVYNTVSPSATEYWERYL